jgi:exopolyphosphatase/guanosine-5'-triphosphate,3'-diphosphate pyrophosphatase
MKKIAVIDVGSNSVRLMLMADGKVLYKTLATTRLGEGLADTPYLNEQAIERSALAVADFYTRAKEEGAEETYAFTTAAVRFAKNGDEFVQRVKQLTALCVEVLSGETEAEIGVLGALGNADGTLIDVGGASTEIIVKKQGEITYKKSVDIGAVRLKDACNRDKEKLVPFIEKYIKEFGQVPVYGFVYAIGGTATTLAAYLLDLSKYDGNKVTGTRISKLQMFTYAEELLQTPVETLEKHPCMPKGRADIIGGGALLLANIMQMLGADKLVVSDRDNLEGYAVKKGLV